MRTWTLATQALYPRPVKAPVSIAGAFADSEKVGERKPPDGHLAKRYLIS
jgi:hypothetical protein